MEDWKQLAEYVKTGSECAFESVVHQHLQMVYATALRTTGNRDMAEEVAQSTFILLARKAAQLKPSGALGAWLHRTALLKSKEHLKKNNAQAERLRMLKETVMPNAETTDALEPILPLLDDAVDTLQDSDRELLLLRYFEKRSLREVGTTLGIGEDAARKRVQRTVEKLRHWFDRRGISISSASIIVCLEQTSAQTMPLTLTASVLSAVQGSSIISATTSTLVSLISIMKLKTASLIGLGIVTVCGLLFVKQMQQNTTHPSSPNDSLNETALNTNQRQEEISKPGILEQIEQLNASTSQTQASQSLKEQFQALLTAGETEKFSDDPAEMFLQGIPVAERGLLWDLVRDALEHPELHVRTRAMHLLPLMWPQHKEALPWIEENLRDGTIQPGEWMNETLYALSQVLTEPSEYARIVDALLETSEETKHIAAFQAPIMMAKFKNKSPEIQSLLSRYLQDENPSKQLLVAQILAQTEGPVPTEVVDILSASLQSKPIDDENQRLVLNLLWKLGPDAKSAVPALMQLADSNPQWGEMVDVLLKSILHDELNGHAIQTPLAEMTPKAQSLVDQWNNNPNLLKGVIQSIEEDLFTQADILALASMGMKAAGAASSMTSKLKTLIQSNPQQAIELGAALERIQPDLPKPLLTAMDLVPIFRDIQMSFSENTAENGVENSFRDWTRNLWESAQGIVLREDMAKHADRLKEINPTLHKQWIEGLIKQDSNWKDYLENTPR